MADPTDPADNESTPADDSQATSRSRFRRRRDRLVSNPPQEKPAASSSPRPPSPAPVPAPGDTDGAAPAAPTGAASAPATAARAVASAAPSPARPAASPAKPEADEEITPARRAVRFVLMAGVFLVAWLGLVVNLKKMQDQRDAQTAAGLVSLPKPAKKLETAQGDAAAQALLEELAQGGIEAAVQRAEALRDTYPGNYAVLRATFLAESAQAVLAAGRELSALPRPRPQEDASVPLQQHIGELANRIQYLRILDRYQEDWNEALTGIAPVAQVYSEFSDEMRTAAQSMENWTAAHAALRKAAALIESDPPAFQECASHLRSAWSFLPLPRYTQLARNSSLLGQADYLLGKGLIQRAVKNLHAVDKKDLELAGPATLLHSIQTVLLMRYASLEAKVGEWDNISTALAQAERLYELGKLAEATASLTAALDSSSPDAPLTQGLRRKVRDRLNHFEAVRKALDAAMQAKQDSGLADQLRAWGAFQKTLAADDAYYQNVLVTELRAIKAEIRSRIASHYQRLDQLARGYRAITLEMRKPENPRSDFAEQAKVLSAMTREAEIIKETADLVPDWNLGDDTSRQVEYATSVMADSNDQARRLYNLYSLYQKHGKLQFARECLVRIGLLGDLSSNPWYTEAEQILTGRKRDAESTTSSPSRP